MSTEPNVPAAEAGGKAKYRVKNWHDHDHALVERGSVTVWFEEAFLSKHWRPAANGKRGAPFEYSDIAIQALLTLKVLFHPPYRALEGFGRSLMRLMSLAWPIPDHTQLSRRAKTLSVAIPYHARSGSVHVVVDSTGLKIYGEGGWKVRQHGAGKRRTWRKVHLALDAGTREVIGVEVTTAECSDGEVFEGRLDQVAGSIEQIDGDGAYGTRGAWAAARTRGARLVVPPRENAVSWEAGHPRNQALADIAELGRKEWKKRAGYHRRSLAENAMYRLKQLFGDRLALKPK